jgi:hypothetical protein
LPNAGDLRRQSENGYGGGEPATDISRNQGQACIAGSRQMSHERIADESLERSTALTKSIRLGNQMVDDRMGPLTNMLHRDRVLRISLTRASGAVRSFWAGIARQSGAVEGLLPHTGARNPIATGSPRKRCSVHSGQPDRFGMG